LERIGTLSSKKNKGRTIATVLTPVWHIIRAICFIKTSGDRIYF
jgi:hypothetical protein